MTTNTKDQLSDSWPTIFELATTIPYVDLTRLGRPGSGKRNAQPVTAGLIPVPFPERTGYFDATPEQLASLRVPRTEVTTDGIKGFQREKINAHARKIAKALLEGEEVPPLIISIFPDGKAYVDDGQHRALGAIVARRPVKVVVEHRTIEQARKLFSSQGKAKTVKRDDTLLTGDSSLELYIQDALTCADHPWSNLVGLTKNGSRMTPTTMAQMVGSFVFNAYSQGASYYTSRPDEDFDERKADLLAELVKVFGTSTTNPFAFRGRTLRAIAYAATWVFQRNPHSAPNDAERWKRHMPQFDFARYPHLLTKENEMAMQLIAHWNKRLPQERKLSAHLY